MKSGVLVTLSAQSDSNVHFYFSSASQLCQTITFPDIFNRTPIWKPLVSKTNTLI